jgi:hypothetical protein
VFGLGDDGFDHDQDLGAFGEVEGGEEFEVALGVAGAVFGGGWHGGRSCLMADESVALLQLACKALLMLHLLSTAGLAEGSWWWRWLIGGGGGGVGGGGAALFEADEAGVVVAELEEYLADGLFGGECVLGPFGEEFVEGVAAHRSPSD